MHTKNAASFWWILSKVTQTAVSGALIPKFSQIGSLSNFKRILHQALHSEVFSRETVKYSVRQQHYPSYGTVIKGPTLAH